MYIYYANVDIPEEKLVAGDFAARSVSVLPYKEKDKRFDLVIISQFSMDSIAVESGFFWKRGPKGIPIRKIQEEIDVLIESQKEESVLISVEEIKKKLELAGYKITKE